MVTIEAGAGRNLSSRFTATLMGVTFSRSRGRIWSFMFLRHI